MSPGDINILVACEHTGALASEFEQLGFNVTSCDLKKRVSPGQHYIGNVFDIVPGKFHVLIAFPPCTYLAKSGLFLCRTDPQRVELRNSALDFVRTLFDLPIPYIAIENPIGYLNSNWRQPNQLIQPFFFGDPYRKEICLWLKGLPPVMSKAHHPLRKHVVNHTNSRMSQAEKSEIKSSWLRYPNMCKEIARQWAFSILKDLKKKLAC